MDNGSTTSVSMQTDMVIVMSYGDFLNQHWAYTVQLVYLVLVVIMGVPTNSFVILVQAKCREKTTTDYYIITLAAVDLTVSSIYTPLRLTSYSKTIWTAIASTFLCTLRLYLLNLLGLATILLLSVISIDRYFKSCRPLSSYGTKAAKRICSSLVIACILVCCPVLVTYHLTDDLRCGFKIAYGRPMRIWSYIVTCLSISSFLTMSYFYARIALTLNMRRRQRLSPQEQQGNTDISEERKCLPFWKRAKIEPKPNSKTITKRAGKQFSGKGLAVTFGCGSEPNQSTRSSMWTSDSTMKTPRSDNTYGSNVQFVSTRKVSVQDLKPREHSNTTERGKTSQSGLTKHVIQGDPRIPLPGAMPGQNPQDQSALRKPKPFGSAAKDFQERETGRGLKQVNKHFDKKRVNKTTRTMFVVSLTYIILRLMTWAFTILRNILSFLELSIFATSFHLLHSIMSLILYICMSSKFQGEAKKLLVRT